MVPRPYDRTAPPLASAPRSPACHQSRPTWRRGRASRKEAKAAKGRVSGVGTLACISHPRPVSTAQWDRCRVGYARRGGSLGMQGTIPRTMILLPAAVLRPPFFSSPLLRTGRGHGFTAQRLQRNTSVVTFIYSITV
jgi:hypothetical protein